MNKYQKVKMIGEGSFGKAFLVRDKSSNRQYVIKEINMGKMGPKEKEDARKEVAVLAQLQHPNIVSYKESFEEIGKLYISMDFCECGDLFGKINSRRGALMPETQVLDMFVQICLAIKHIHDRKILHRDIKSQNIFISKGGIMKVGDFGIAKVMNSTMELARTCIGTPYYLSPEICENRPYNNKSDIWSLGCVLYEMTTLKHPFEAGSMKNLVLKIIRGTYPPVPSRYSYDLRNLLSQLFKNNPRDRPSINGILKKAFIQERIKRFLNESELQSEFSHTVLHGERLHKRLPPGGRPVSAPVAKKPTPAPTPSAQRYDPSSVYKSKVAPKRPVSAAARAVPVAKPSSGGPVSRPSSSSAQRNNDVVAKRRELVEKERKRKAELAVRKSDEAKLQHQRFVEKQKQDRINKGKEQWRNNLLDSYGEKKDSDKPSPKEQPAKPAWMDPVVPPPSEAPRGNYARYHEALDKQMKDREARLRQPANGGGGDVPAANPVSAANKAAAIAQENRQKGADSAERARVVQDYRERQRQAMINKARGQANLFGGGRAAKPPSGRSGVENRPRSGRNAEEESYLQMLRQIRLQNFNDRRAVQDRKAGRPDIKEAERLRNLKIDALKAQAEERSNQLKAQLERHRKDVLANWQQQQQQQRPVPAARPSSAVDQRQENVPSRAVPARPVSAAGGRAVPVKATPMPGLTKALGAIGADLDKSDGKPTENVPSMTNVMADIGVAQQPTPQQDAAQVQAAAGRQKWGAPPATPLVGAAKNPNRGKWEGDKDKIDLSNAELETTASQMEATAAEPAKRAGWGKPTVLKPAPISSADSRPAWGSPSGTVVNVLQSAAVIDSTTVIISPQQAQDAVKFANAKLAEADPLTNQKTEQSNKGKQQIGVTISMSEPLILKKPTLLKSNGATITISKDQPDAVSDDNKLADTSVPLFDKAPKPSTPENKMAADSALDVVDIELDEREKRLLGSLERATQPFMLKTSGLMIGLTVGNFDCNMKLLRTCSEPDLAKLFHTVDNPFIDVASSAIFANSSDSESEGDNVEAKDEVDAAIAVSRSDEDEENGEDEDSDDADTTQYEAELAALVSRQDSESTQESESRSELDSVTPSAMERSEDGDEESVDVLDGAADEDIKDFDEQDAADFEQMRETLQQLLQDGKRDAGKKSLTSTQKQGTLADAISSIKVEVANLSVEDREEWMSDNSSDSDHDSGVQHENEEDRFSRLEESRANLETELGESTFIKAYKIIQATQEDEEENIDEGRKLVTKVIGDEKIHLYDKILHLVVSDSAYLDDS